MSNYLDDSHLAEIGEEYERFVGAYFEKFHSCMVIYQGRILGKQDGGIDLIAVAKDKTYLIQCKNYLPSKLIHENVVNQLSGATKVFSAKYPSARNVTPILVYTCQIDGGALYSARINGITLKRLDYQKKTVDDRLVLFNSDFSTEGYAPISAGLNMLPNYEIRLKAVLDVVQEHQPEPDKEIVLSPGPVFIDPDKQQENTAPIKSPVSKRPAPDGKYFIRTETPLTFHYVQRNLLGPLNILSTVGAFFGPDYADAPWLIALDSIPVIAIILFILGASRFTKYSYRSTLVWRFFSPVCYAIIILISLLYGMPDLAIDSLPTLIAGLVWAIPTFIYYRKRKALFYPELIPSNLAEYYEMDSSESETPFRKPSFFARHSVPLLTFGIIAVFLLVAGVLSSFGQSVDQNSNSSPTPTTKAATTVKPTAKPTVKPTTAPESVPKPVNGHYKGYWYSTKVKQHWDGEMTVKTPDDGMYYCLIFVDADDPSNKCFSVFVWPDSEKTIDVPTIDNLLLYTVCGKEWYGYDEYFGAKSIWSTSDDIFNFDKYIHTLTFEKVVDGNWETEDISSYEVPFLN